MKNFKNFLTIFICLVLLVGVAYSQAINVTSPKAGDRWCIGQPYTIAWTVSGTVQDTVKIRLYQGSTKILDIVNQTENDGSYYWTIPASVPGGTYMIRVKTNNNLVADDSDIFWIVQCQERIVPTHEESPKPLIIKKPDLTLGKFTLEPKPRYMGDRVVFKAEIKNIGEGQSRPAKAEIKITGPQGFRTLHTADYNIPRLDPGAVHEYVLGYTASHHGIVRHMVKVDIGNSNLESNENNNEKAAFFGVNPLPELIVCLKFPQKASFCKNHAVTAEVINIGGEASLPCTLHFYIKDKKIKTYTIPRLEPNSKYPVTRTHKWCKLWKTGWKTVWAHIDKDNIVHEVNPNNNYVKGRFNVLKYTLESGAVSKYICSNSNR